MTFNAYFFLITTAGVLGGTIGQYLCGFEFWYGVFIIWTACLIIRGLVHKSRRK